MNPATIENEARDPLFIGEFSPTDSSLLHLVPERLSEWGQSSAKRIFDVGVVLAISPVLLPLIMLIALGVRLTSRGPIFFFQKRVGRYGKPFTIVKFRTMVHSDHPRSGTITTTDNRQITYLGRFLRYWKLDELPQFLNVLRSDMSLVGPRPKVPEQQIGELRYRPGITGAASIAFAREELLLAALPKEYLHAYYLSAIVPLKQRLDDAYMARATLLSDLKLLLKTGLRRWDAIENLEMLAIVRDGTYCDHLRGRRDSAALYDLRRGDRRVLRNGS